VRKWPLIVAMVFAGALANAAPPASAVNPDHAYLFPDDDNYAGSGREAKASALKLPARRTMWLRLRFDTDNAALLGIVSRLPSFVAEAFPEVDCDRASSDLLFSLMRSTFEHRPNSLATLANEAQLPIAVAATRIEAFARAGLVNLAGDWTGAAEHCWILATPELRRRGSRFVERLYGALTDIDL
jgi:hypothetical protein